MSKHVVGRWVGFNSRITAGRTVMAALGLAVTLVALPGCEVDSYLDPSRVGRWERTPAFLPILDRLAVIEPAAEDLNVTQVRAEDLVPDMSEYVLGPGDLITVSIFELFTPGQDAIFTRRIDETGRIRLPEVGPVQTAGISASQLEREVAQMLEREGILRTATVSVVVQQSQQNTFSFIGEAGVGPGGTFLIPKPDFRVLDAVALAGGMPARVKTLRVYRPSPLTPEVAGERPSLQDMRPEATEPVEQAPQDPSQLIEDLMQGIEQDGQTAPQPAQPGTGTGATGGATTGQAAPSNVAGGLDSDAAQGQWVFVGGEWVRVDAPAGADTGDEAEMDRLSKLMTQRIIEVPYDDLIDGQLKYNLVIRPGDKIRVPDQTSGFAYLMGSIARPGAFTVPGEKDLTLMQLIASAGGLTPDAWPNRVDLIRRIGEDEYAMVRLDIRRIFEGTQPDFFVKANDVVNVGTSFLAVPLAVLRNGMRISYGVGFVWDRNFAPDDDNNNR